MSDLQFLKDREDEGDLIHLISSEFTGNADQVTYTPANGKTFYHIKSKLYPVVNTVAHLADNSANRRADVELTFDSTVIDVLTHDMESYSEAPTGVGHGSVTGQYETNIFESMDGDGVKVVKLTSTNNSGTFRVSLLGFIDDT